MIYFINPQAATNGTGTAASPFNDPASAPLAAGNEYAFMRGSTWTGAFPSLTNGTSGNLTIVRAYANLDGTDDASLPKPIIDIGDRQMPGTLGSPKTFMKWSDIDLRNNRTALSSDTPIMWLGSDVEFVDCWFTSNLTGLYAENKSRIKFTRCRITAATASTTTHAINALVCAGTQAMTGIEIDGLDVIVGDGGPTGAHAVKITNTVPFADLKIKNFTARTASGLPTTHINKAGLFVQNATGTSLANGAAASIEISHVDVTNFVDGIFLAGVRNAWVHHWRCDGNNSFGLHGTGSSPSPFSGNVIEWFIANENGRDVSPWYGRGVEISGGGQLHGCTGNTIRFFQASRNKNYGGPSDNGTEGVGIGLDDAASFNLVYGGICEDNEGQGVQLYGGSVPPADTGGNIVTGLRLINNGAAAIWGRRTGGTYKTPGSCNVSVSNVHGSRTVFTNNLIVGGYGGYREGSECTNVSKHGNVFMSQTAYAISVAATTGIGTNVYAPGIPKNVANLALDGNNSPAPVLLSAGVNGDLTTSPLLDASYLPQAGSPLLGRSVPWAPVPEVSL